MTKLQMIERLMKSDSWNESDKGFLDNQSDEALSHLVDKADKADKGDKGDKGKSDTLPTSPKTETPLVTPSNNGQETPSTKPAVPRNAEQYVAEAPPEIREVLTHGLRTHQAAKQRLIEQISANKNNVFTKEQLAAKSFYDLEAIAKLATPPETAETTANFAGMGEMSGNAGEEEALALPTFEACKA